MGRARRRRSRGGARTTARWQRTEALAAIGRFVVELLELVLRDHFGGGPGHLAF